MRDSYDISSVLDNLAKSGKLRTNDKRWIAAQINKQHERNVEYKLMDVFARDPEFKYYLGMAAGAGVGFLGSLIKNMAPASISEEIDVIDPADAFPYMWLVAGAPGGIGVAGLLASLDWSSTGSTTSEGGLSGQMGNILALGGTGFAGTCAMILILKAIFTGTDLGELLSGVGEIIPL